MTLWSWAADVGGRIGGDLEGQMRTLDLHGRIDHNVDVSVRRLTVSDETSVGSDLGFRSPRPAVGIEDADVGGAVVHRLPLAPNIRIALVLRPRSRPPRRIAGLVVMWALPGLTSRAIARVSESWWRAWLRGLGVLALPVVVVGLALLLLRLAPLQAAIPFLGVLGPMFIALLGLVLMLGFVAPAAVFPWLGRISQQRGRYALRLPAALVVLASRSRGSAG